MDTVFFTPEPQPGLPGDAKSGDLMSSATKPIKRALLETSAANADELGENLIDTTVRTKGIEGTGAWDAYIRLDGVLELWERVRGKPFVVKPPTKQSYGDTELEVRDPNGYILVFGELVD